VREGLTQLRHATADHAAVLGRLLEVAAKVAQQEKLEGFRIGERPNPLRFSTAGRVHVCVFVCYYIVKPDANAACLSRIYMPSLKS
jgi:hypothetical protein